MMISRRMLLAIGAQVAAHLAAANTWASVDSPLRRLRLGIVIHSYGIRRSRSAGGDFAQPLVFLEYCRQLGAAGIQTNLGSLDQGAVQQLREAATAAEMYVEGIVDLPRDAADVERFARELRTAKDCGARVVRTVTLSGRRYEVFADHESFQQFARESFRRLEWARPVIEREELRLAVENHKDWRVEELLDILQRLNCPYLGVCLDTGNSIALLEDPHEVVEAYAPVALTTHFKDMAVREYEEGFLLSEVPLGQGFLDLDRLVRTLRASRPDISLNLEMITRDPLRVPCLGKKYWATLDTLPGSHLAASLSLVRRHAAVDELPQVTGKSADEQLRFEDENVRRSLTYAADRLAGR